MCHTHSIGSRCERAHHSVHHRGHGVKNLHRSNCALIHRPKSKSATFWSSWNLKCVVELHSMEKGRSTPKQYGSLDQTELCGETGKQGEKNFMVKFIRICVYEGVWVLSHCIGYLTSSSYCMHERRYFYIDAVLFYIVNSLRNEFIYSATNSVHSYRKLHATYAKASFELNLSRVQLAHFY